MSEKPSLYGKNLYLCQDENVYISLYQVCDGIVDCASGEDERNCTSLPSRYICNVSDTLLTSFHVCDYNADCPDKSDEQFCGIYLNTK